MAPGNGGSNFNTKGSRGYHLNGTVEDTRLRARHASSAATDLKISKNGKYHKRQKCMWPPPPPHFPPIYLSSGKLWVSHTDVEKHNDLITHTFANCDCALLFCFCPTFNSKINVQVDKIKHVIGILIC